ncbi:DUF5125 domain-containing protein [Sphingobacterium sp. MYb382]|uniref:DUF5125 domain-containing protein n=1 Tax=Sphingobacterium sp. MYb382 TaxID=2745278 RepID=UPI0030AFBDF2
MKSLFAKGIVALGMSVVMLASCQKEDKYTYYEGNPVMDFKTKVEPAFFGDSLSFTIHASDSEIPLSTLKAQLFFTEEMVSETVIRTKENGDYTAKIFVPFYKNVANGKATLKFVLQNITKKTVQQEFELPLSRPDFPFLLLETPTGEYKMNRVAANQYEVEDTFTSSLNAFIKAPKFGTNGNEFTFGWGSDGVALGSKTEIPFSSVIAGKYKVSFNTLTFQAAPFVAPAINNIAMKRIDNDHYVLDMTLGKGDALEFKDIDNVDSWWIDPDFLTKKDGKVTFNALAGKYRITADFKNKYFVVEALAGDDFASLKADGTGAIWIIGEGVGKPDVATNQVGWTTEKALCLAPIGNKKYQITFVGKKTINENTINFKFFHQKGWGGEFGGTSISTKSNIIFIGDGKNDRDPGNLGIVKGSKLEAGKTYKFTVDLSAGNDKAVLTVE